MTNSLSGCSLHYIFVQAYNLVLNSSEETSYADEDLIDIDTLLEEDSFMSIAFE
jgi:hypothetical protein